VAAACFIIDVSDLGGAAKLRAMDVLVRTLMSFEGTLTLLHFCAAALKKRSKDCFRSVLMFAALTRYFPALAARFAPTSLNNNRSRKRLATCRWRTRRTCAAYGCKSEHYQPSR